MAHTLDPQPHPRHSGVRARSSLYPLVLLALTAALTVLAQFCHAQDSSYIRVASRSARVSAEPSEESAKLGVAEPGQRFRMVDYTQDWFKIVYLEGKPPVEGWILRAKCEIESKDSAGIGSALQENRLVIILGASGLAALAIVVWLIALLLRRAERSAASKMATGKELVIVAQQPKEIKFTLTNTTSTIEKCVNKVGYAVHRAPTLQAFAQRIKHHVPDVVLVDWEAVPPAADEVEMELAADLRTRQVPVVHYNVPADIPSSRRPKHRNVSYLGTDFADRDLFKIVQPLATGHQQTTIQRKSNDSSAIEGDITEGSLGSVFQLVEIGQKSGCLLIRNQDPAGMIFFENGNPICAATRTCKGEKAIYEILDMTAGQFRFVSGQQPPERNCATTTMGVLMEWARLKDEKARG